MGSTKLQGLASSLGAELCFYTLLDEMMLQYASTACVLCVFYGH